MKVFIFLMLCLNAFALIATGDKIKKNKRKLGLLDWFDSDEEKEEASTVNQPNMEKIMELIKMADSFKSDPHFKVSLNISYKNLDSAQLEALR